MTGKKQKKIHQKTSFWIFEKLKLRVFKDKINQKLNKKTFLFLNLQI